MRAMLLFAVLLLINTGAAMDLRGPIVSIGQGQIELNTSNFPGFYYSSTTYEKLVMKFSSNGSVNAGDATYTLTVSSGSTAFLGKPYKSLNYLNSPTGNANLLSEYWSKGSKSKGEILGINQSLVLSEGYEIVLKDVMGREGGKDQARLELRKDGKAVVESAVAPGDYFEYSKNIKGSNYTLITSEVNWVFSGVSSNESIKPVYNASILGIQYSENPIEIKVGDKYGEFEVKTITNKSIVLKNTAAITFSLDSEVSILDGFIKFRTAKDVYKAYAINRTEEAKSYELRGTPIGSGSSFQWNANNFGGMFYDIENDVWTEWLNVTIDKTNKQIAEGKLVYETAPVKIPYRNPEMAGFSESYFKDRLPVIGWQGERYAAIGSAGRLSRILLDTDDKQTLHIGELWDLGEGYTLTVKDIGEEDRAAVISLAKNGLEVYSGIVEPGKSADLGTHTLLYTKKINGVLAPIFSVYVEAVLNGKQGMAQFKYPLMISDSPLEINTGDSFGNVTVISNSDKLKLENDHAVPFYDATVDATGDIWFKGSATRFYPLITKIQQGESYISTSPLPEVPAEEYLMGET